MCVDAKVYNHAESKGWKLTPAPVPHAAVSFRKAHNSTIKSVVKSGGEGKAFQKFHSETHQLILVAIFIVPVCFTPNDGLFYPLNVAINSRRVVVENRR